jgi:uncharacterized membrane protein YjjP (DUF1212 family)
MNNPFSHLFKQNLNRISLIVCITLLAVAAIRVWGYYKGLNILIPVFVLCLVGAVSLWNAFLGWLTLGVFVTYFTLSLVTIAE